MAGWKLESTEPDLVVRLAPGTARTVGRTTQADFILEAPLVSRLHCRLAVDDAGRLTVEDLGSTNGTLLNGRRVTRSAVQAGDVLTIGRVEFRTTPVT